MDAENFDLPRYLALLPLFSDLAAAELHEVAGGCQVRRLNRGELVFRVGQPCEEFHVVVTGRVKLFALSPSGQEKVIELVGPGHSFAEALMFVGRPYILSAQCLLDSMLVSVGKRTVVAAIERDPRFSMHMLAGLSRRLHGLVHDVESYALCSGVQRVIGYLLRDQQLSQAAEADGLTVNLGVSKATIASRLSLTPEYFSRVLHELEAAGLIEIDKRDIHIRDVRRLANHGTS